MREVAEALIEVLDGGGRGALATVVRTAGSTPQEPGARLLLRPDGSTVGTVGGGAIEHEVLAALREAQETGQGRLLARDLGYDLGMCCGGRMEIFIEPVEGGPRLWLFGAGHIAQPTATLARSVGFEVTVVDEREALNTAERFPGCRRELGEPTGLLTRATLGERDWLVVVTHDHRLDEELLERALQKRPRFVGLVGSRRKTFRLLQRIRVRLGHGPRRIAGDGQGGDDAEDQAQDQTDGQGEDGACLDRLYAPVGLDIGAVGPQEIAVSVVAELIALRRGRQAAHLRAVEDGRLLRVLGA